MMTSLMEVTAFNAISCITYLSAVKITYCCITVIDSRCLNDDLSSRDFCQSHDKAQPSVNNWQILWLCEVNNFKSGSLFLSQNCDIFYNKGSFAFLVAIA